MLNFPCSRSSNYFKKNLLLHSCEKFKNLIFIVIFPYNLSSTGDEMKFFLILITLCLAMNITAQKRAFINGNIYTVNPDQPRAEAVLIENNRISAVGTNDEIKNLSDSQTETTDLKGKLMLPGFIDNHVHFINGGFYLLGIDLRDAGTTTEFKRIIKDYAERHPGQWITGGNWDHEAWEVTELPVKEMIDDFTISTPVLVDRFDGHMALANSYALKLANITKDTESPEGGLIVKDPATGEPTGILKDNAIGLVSRHIPISSDEEYYEAAITALEHVKQFGITSVQDITYKKDLDIYRKLEEENKLTCRIYTRYPIAAYKMLVDNNYKTVSGSDKLKLGSLKAFSDGSLGSSTAWFYEKYDQDTTTVGLAMEIITDGSLEKWAIDADKNRLQICTHAIGDKANAYMLDLYRKITEINPSWDRRFRIEHAQHVKFEDIPRFAENNVIASAQPYHCIDDGVWAEKRIGPERIKYTYPFRTFIDNDVLLCFGSDWTVAPVNPLLGIYAAVTRRTLDNKNPDGWIPEQKITVEEAVKCYTINNAYAAFEEKDKGTIEKGKLADFVILNEDIFRIDPVKIKDVTVYMTIFDGNVIYKNE
jgi:predicted amidohydrolase YtcJ